jgi:hypothetical protein
MLEESTPGAGCEDQGEVYSTEDAFGLQLAQPDSTDYFLGFAWPFGGTIASLIVQTGIGAGVATLKINEIPVVGIANVVIDQTLRTYVAQSANLFVPGDNIIFEIVSGGGAITNLNATVPFSR